MEAELRSTLLDAIFAAPPRFFEQLIVDLLLAMQGFVGALHGQGANKGVFITTSDFTPDARAFAEKLGGMRVVLINGEALTRLMLQHDVGVRTHQTVAIRRLDTDYFNDDADTS